MADKSLLEAARQKLRAAKAAPATAEGKATSSDATIELARKKLQAAKAASTASPTAVGAPTSPPLPRLKGDVRPVEPVAGVSAVSSAAAAPESGVPEARGLSALFARAKQSVMGGTLADDLTGLVAEGASTLSNAVGTGVEKSKATALRDIESAKALGGVGDAEAFVEATKAIQDVKYQADLEREVRAFGEEDSLLGKVRRLQNPAVVAALLSEQAANVAFTTGVAGATTLAGSAIPGVGNVAGLATGLFASSAAGKAAEVVPEFLQEKGIDLGSEEQVRGFFANPQALSELRAYATKAGVALGAIDAVVGLLGAKGAGSALAKPFVAPFIKPVEKMVDGKLVSKVVPGAIAEGAANTVMDLAGAGIGEAASQLASKGVVNMPDVYDEVLLGIAASGAEATISTLVSRSNRSGRAPTAEELLAAGVVTPPAGTSPEIMTTPDEAIAEGRTLFGFVENEDQNPVELGSYEEAERKAGAGDIRRGKIIAVKEDQAQIESSLGEVAQKLEAILVNPNSDAQLRRLEAVQAVQDFVKRNGIEASKAATLRDAVKANFDKFEQGAAAQDVLTDLMQTLTPFELPSSRKASYSGDRKGLAVSPRVRNAIPIDTFKRGLSGTVIPSSGFSAQTKFIDGDKLQNDFKSRGWTLVPGNIKRIIAGNARMEKLLDTTFTFTTPEARQRFIDGNLDERTTLMKSGDVRWTDKLDGRFFPSNALGLPTEATEIAVLRQDGSVVDADEAINAMNSLLEPGLGTDQWDQRWMWGERQYPGGMDKPNVEAEFAKLVGKTSGAFRVFSSRPVFKQWGDIFERWHKQFRVQKPTIYVEVYRDKSGKYIWPKEIENSPELRGELNVTHPSTYSGMAWDLGEYGRIVVLRTNNETGFDQRSDEEIYSTLTHEMGHVISAEHFANAPLEVRNKIFAAYRRFILANPLSQQDYEQFRRRRFAKAKYNRTYGDVSSQSDYYLRFEEWFAEQVAKWGDTNARPLGVLGRFFRGLAKKIIALYKAAHKKENKLESRAELEVDLYLAAVWDGADVLTNWPQTAVQYMEKESRARNATVDAAPLPLHETTANVSAVLSSVEKQPFLSAAQKSLLAATRAGVDRYGWFSKWALNLRQLAARNLHIQELQLINELFDFAKLDASRIMTEAEGYLQRWRRRSKKQQEALNDLLFELNEMSYLKPGEQSRWPTAAEFADMVKRLGMDADTLALYKDIRDFFLNSVRRQEELQLQEAARITDPTLQQAAIKSAQDMSRAFISRPYFPQMRFGKWALTIKDPNGKTEDFITFQTKKELQRAAALAAQQYPESAGWIVNASSIPQEVQPFMGVPPWMLEKLRDMPGLSPQQQDWLESFRYQLAPATSFRKRLMKRKNTRGFSHDGRRVFANYAFHHARFYARIKHDWDLRQAIDSLRRSRNPGLGPADVSQRVEIADFVENIYKEFRNPSQDWAALRVLNAIWHLAYVPASAMVNMTQTVLATAPYLSAKFGNVQGEGALMNAARKLSTYYKQGSYKGMNEPEFKAIARAVEDGKIDESMAAELAAMAVGSGAGLTAGNSFTKEKLAVGWQYFTEKGMFMFRMAEQWNRRVSFRAAWQLAYDNPGNEWVTSLQTKHFLKYDQLLRSGWTSREALAYLAGVEVLDETHYTYDRLARPRFMQGRKSVLFAFYMFTQNSLFMLWNNKDMLARYMLYTAILAGPMGLVPDDAEEVLNAIGRQLFGKDFNLEREARKLVLNLLDDDSSIPPDMILHGISRYSFGLSKAGDFLGAKFVPDVDMSKSLQLSRVLPINVTSLLKPAADWNERLANMTRDAAGAAYGIPLAVSKAVMGSDLDLWDFKRWESAMPRAFRQATRAGRLAIEGGERNNQMSRTIPYAYEDPEELAELVAIAAGFTPTKQSQYWDRQMAEKELDTFWKAQKSELYEELFQSKFIYEDDEAFRAGIEKVRKYNERAPQGYAITAKGLKSALETRQKNRILVERGENPYIKEGVEAEIQRLYPEGAITQQKAVR